MESPPRRGPPPPSEPPPPNISRSGRVPPPPKGAPPPEGARRARLTRQRPSKPPVVGSNASGGGKRSESAGQRDEEQSTNRRASYEQPSQSDEASPSSDESSRGSFESNVDSDREEHVHNPTAASRRRQGRPPSDDKSNHIRREDSADGSSSLASLSTTRSQSPDGRRRRKADNRARGTGNDRESSRSDSTCSNEDDVTDDGTFRNRGGKGESGVSKEGPRRGGHRRDGDRVSDGRPRRDESLSGSDSDRGRTDSTSGLDSEGGGGRRDASRRYSSSDQHRLQRGRNKGSKHYKERDESASDPESEDGRDSYTKGGDSPPHTRMRRRISGDRSKRDGGNSNDSKPGRRRRSRKYHDSEGEGYGWSSNKSGWDAVDSASADTRSDQPRSPVLATRSDDAPQVPLTPAKDADTEDGATHTGNNTSGAQRGAERSADHGKDLRGTPAARSGLSATGGSFSQQSPGAQADSSAPAGNPPKPAVATVGKAIRGARWGEAIGVRSKVFDATTIPTTKTDLKTFVTTPLCSGPGTVLRCFIERDRSGTHKFSHVFSLYADLEDGSGRLLLAARKLLASKTAHYVVCVRQDDLFRESGKRGGTSFLAKLRASSTDPTEYALYDGGENPTSAANEAKGDSIGEAKSTSMRSPLRGKALGSKALGEEKQGELELRKELGVIIYNFDKKEQRTGKRRMEVAIPQLHEMGESYVPVSWQPSDAKESIKPNFGRIRYQGAQNFLQDDRLLVFHQRESRYDPLSSCLVDFRGRATAPSVKNFQLIKSPPEDNVKRARYFSEGAGKDESESDDLPRPVYLQMGKVGKDCFNVDVEWPLSLLQAFAICLSRFDTNAHF